MALLGKKKPADTASANDVAGGGAPVVAKARPAKNPKTPRSSAAKGGTVVGLNIGNAYIKAVEVTSKGGQLAVTGVGVIATPPESYNNGNVLSVTALSNALRQMWRQAGLSSKATVFSVAGSGSLVVRVIELPRMTDGELADNMRVDADRYIPFPPSEVVMDVQALRDLPSDPDAANMEVLLAAAQREIIDLHLSVVQKAKLAPRAIDVEPLALARTLQLELRAQNPVIDYDDVTAMLNIGQTGTEISILRGDIVVFTRTVPNGGGNLTQAIAETMGIPLSDAERLKIERGDALPPAGYGQNAGADDFGFGDFDAGETVDFGGEAFDSDFGADAVTSSAVTASPTAATSPAASATPASDDPFDLDFFDQGPQQSEPGAGHGQKEGDEDDQPAGIRFSFDKMDDELSPSLANQTAPAAPADAFGIASEDAGDRPASLDSFDLPDSYLPAMNTEASGQTAPATPEANEQAASAVPSAFDFSDFDLPTTEQEPAAPDATHIAAPTRKLSEEATQETAAPASTGFSFGFSDPDPAPAAPVADPTPVAETAPLSFEMEDVPAQETVIAPVSFDPVDEEEAPPVQTVIAPQTPVSLDKSDEAQAPQNEGFDMDDLFGADDVAAVADVAAASANAPNAEAVFNDVEAAQTGDFDVDTLNVAGTGDEDFSNFGAGLSQSGDTNDVTLYAAMQPVLDDLATEVRRSLEFHLGRYPDTTFSRMVLVGGGAKLRNLDEFLTGNLGVPTVVGNPFAHIKIDTPGLPTEFVPTNAPLCAVALGLALREFTE